MLGSDGDSSVGVGRLLPEAGGFGGMKHLDLLKGEEM